MCSVTCSSLAAFGKSSDAGSMISGIKEAWRSSAGYNWDGQGFTYWHTLKVVSSQEDLCAVLQIHSVWPALSSNFTSQSTQSAAPCTWWVLPIQCQISVGQLRDPCRRDCEHAAAADFPSHSHGQLRTKLVVPYAQVDLVPVEIFAEMTGWTGRSFKAGRRNTPWRALC